MSKTALRRRAKLDAHIAAQSAAAVPKAPANLEISELSVYAIREPVSGVSYAVLRVRTRSELTGWGECKSITKEDLAAAQHYWAGRPATSYVHPKTDSAIAGAVDMALLDIVGKACNAPIYRVLGGPTRNKVRAFTSVNGADHSETVAAMKRAGAAGYKAFGLTLPAPAARNQGQAYQLAARRLAEEVRSQGGDFVLEGAELLTPGDAGSVATTMQPLHPLWFDEPCTVTNLQTIHKIADESVLPLGFGREIATPGAFQDLLRLGLIDVVRPDLHRFGITATRRIAALAETYYVAVSPNNLGGPIATAAALQLAASLPNFFIQHIPFPAAEEDRAMRAQLTGGGVETVKDGFAALTTGPGLGITVNESALEKYHAS